MSTKIFFTTLILLGILGLQIAVPVKAQERIPDTHAPRAAACLQVLIPLYIYPNWYAGAADYQWDDVVTANSQVSITAIINPASGPTTVPNADYIRGQNDLLGGTVNMIGYVATDYANRPIANVKAEIDIYAGSAWDTWITGIFFDEGASGSTELAYYTELYNYVHAKATLSQVVVNPGTNSAETYFSTPATDISVIFESFNANWSPHTPAAYVANYSQERFSMLSHESADVAAMQAAVDLALARNFGYVYVTDQLLATDPWDDLPTYWQAEIDYIEQTNLTCTTPTAINTLTAETTPQPSTLLPLIAVLTTLLTATALYNKVKSQKNQ